MYVNPVVENLRRDLKLVEVRKSLEFAEIRGRLQDAEVELVKLRQPLVLRSRERWLVLEMPPEVDLSSTLRVPDYDDLGVRGMMSRKRTDAV